MSKLETEVKWDFPNRTHYIETTLGNQTFRMEFEEFDCTLDTVYLNVCMMLYNKRTQAGYNEDHCLMTGETPFATCLLAMRCFEALEKKAVEYYHRTGYDVHISCFWVDNRRRDAYYKFLSKRGYQYGRLGDRKVIYKKINRKGKRG